MSRHEDTLLQRVATGRLDKWTVVRARSGDWVAAAPGRDTDRDVHSPHFTIALWFAEENARQDAELAAIEDLADVSEWDEANVDDALRRRP